MTYYFFLLIFERGVQNNMSLEGEDTITSNPNIISPQSPPNSTNDTSNKSFCNISK